MTFKIFIEKKYFIESEICLFMIEALLVAYQAFIPLLFPLKENLLVRVLTPFSQGAHWGKDDPSYAMHGISLSAVY